MRMTAVFTGITGKSGRYTIERLIERKDDVKDCSFRAVVRSPEKAAFLLESGLPIELSYGSIEDAAFFSGVCAGADTLLHIAGIHTSRTVVPVAIAAGIRRIIVVHTTGVYSKYKSAGAEYNRIDQEITYLCETAGVKLTILRPTMIYGGLDDENVAKFISMMDRLPVMPVVAGARFALQPVHRRDLGRAYADVLLSEKTAGRNYVLSGKEPITLREMLNTIAELLHKPARFISVPYWIAIAGAWVIYLCSFTKLDYREKVQRLVEPRAYPHDDATRDFGYSPVGFQNGVTAEVAEHQKRKNAYN